jgi:hypothetical protein
VVLVALVVLVGCTANQRARSFGGTMNVTLPKGQEFVNVTWKGEDLWILTKNKTEGHQPTTYTFKADTSFGIMEGEVVIKEQ